MTIVDEFNIDNLCWKSADPHSDGTWPNAPESVTQVMDRRSPEQVAKITQEKAMRHYQFDPFAQRPRGQCTAATLRDESPDVDTVTHVGRWASKRDLASLGEMSGLTRTKA